MTISDTNLQFYNYFWQKNYFMHAQIENLIFLSNIQVAKMRIIEDISN